MSVIEGYRFAISLEDRGMTRGLRVIKNEAQALKSVMRANFTTLREGEGAVSAYSQRMKDASNASETYRIAIKKLEENIQTWKQELKQSGGENDALNGKIVRAINTIERYKRVIGQLDHQIEQDKLAVERAKTGIDSFRKSTEAIETANKAWNKSLEESKNYYQAERSRIQGLKAERESLKSQLEAEIKVTQQLGNSQKKLQSDYSMTKSALDKNCKSLISLYKEMKVAENRYTQLSSELGKNNSKTNDAKADLEKLRKEFDDTAEAIDKNKNKLHGLSEELGKSAKTYANQAAQAEKTASNLNKISKEASGLKTTRLASFNTALKRMHNDLKQNTGATKEWASSVKSGFGIAAAGIGGVAVAVTDGVKKATELQQTYKEITNLAVVGGERTVEATRNVTQMQKDGRNISLKYGLAQKDIAKGYEDLIKRGYTTKQAMGAMQAEVEASVASGEKFSDVTTVASQTIEGFGLKANNTAAMLANTKRVTNELAYVADATSSGFNDIGVGMSYVNSAAHQAGFALNETAAAMGIMSNNGLEADKAGTGLRKVINSLSTAVKKIDDKDSPLKKLGITKDDLVEPNGQLKSLTEIMGVLGDKTSGLSKTEKTNIFKSLFGTTGQQAGMILSDNVKELSELSNKVKAAGDSGTYVNKIAQKNMATTQGQLKKLKAAIDATAINIGKQVLPAVNEAAKYFANWVVSDEGKQSIKDVSGLVTGLVTNVTKHIPSIISFISGAESGLKGVWSVVKPIATGIGKVVSALGLSDKNARGFANGLGKVIGVLAGITLGVKTTKTLLGGAVALGKDSFGIVKTIGGWIGKLRGKQSGVNGVLKETNVLLEEQLRIQKEINKLTNNPEPENKGSNKSNKHGGGSGGDLASDVLDAVDDVADSSDGKVAKDVEKMGEKHARFWQRGWLGKFTGWNKKVFNKLDPTNLIQKFANLGDKSGKGLIKGLISKLNPVNIYKNFKSKLLIRQFEELGNKAGTQFTKGTSASLLNNKGKIKFSALFKYGNQAAEAAGTSSGLGWARRFVARIGDAHVASKSKWNTFFNGGSIVAEEAGAKGAGGFLGKFAGKLATGANVLAGAWSVASAGIDIVKGIRSHNPEQKMTSFGKAGGMAVGTAIGAAIGGPGGAVVGSQLGEMLGGQLPRFVKWGKEAWSNIRKGWDNGLKWFNQLFSGDMKGVQKGWNNFWGDMGNKFDKTFGVDTGNHKSSSKNTKTTVTSKIINSGVKVTKTEIANVKKMSSALSGYATQLKRVHNEIKNDQVEKQLESVNSFLVKHTKSWKTASDRIKSIGDAFKYLATFASSMVKKDAFAAFNQDLPRLDSTLKSHAQSIKTGLGTLNKAFKGTTGKGGLNSTIDSLGKTFESFTKKVGALNNKLDQTASDFKAIGKVISKFTGKNNPFENMSKGLDDLKKALDKDTKKITEDVQKIRTAFQGTKKQKTLASLFTDAEKPLDSLTADFKSLGKNGPKVGRAFKDIRNSIESLSKGGGKNKKGSLSQFQNDLDALDKKLKTLSPEIAGRINKITNAVGTNSKKKSGLIKSLTAMTSNLKTADDKLETSSATFDKFYYSVRDVVTKLKEVSQKTKDTKDSLNDLVSSLKKAKDAISDVYSKIERDPFGDKISEQAKNAVDTLKSDNGNYTKQLKTMNDQALGNQMLFSSSYQAEWTKMWSKNQSAMSSWTKNTLASISSFNKKFQRTWNSMATGVERIFTRMWSTMKTKAGKGMNSVLSILNSAIGKVDTVISRFGGNSNAVKKVGYVKYASGTGAFNNIRRPITKPTLALLNDGNDSPETGNKEAIWDKRTGEIGVVQGRNTPFYLEPGQEVLNASETRELGLTHYATGTGSLKALYEEAKKYWKAPTATAKTTLGSFSGNQSGAIREIAQGMFKHGVTQATDWWVNLWKMVEKEVDDGGSLTGLAKAAAKYGDGKPYVWGSHGPSSFDCSGLVQYTLQHKYGISLPAPSGTQYAMTQHISKANAKPGDLVFWGPGGDEHVGIYMGGNKYYSAQSESQGIGVNTLDSVVGKGAPLFGRIKGLHIKDEDEEKGVKTSNKLQARIKPQVGKGFWKTINKIAYKYGEAIGGIAGKPSGDHTHWMKQAGIPANWYSKLDWMINGESGWNPQAVNPSSGTYGLGQMQSYNLHYYTAHGSKSNPIAQLMGVKDYILERYGSIDNAYAFRRANNWYADGGISVSEKVAHISEGNKPEAIIPLDLNKRSRAQELLADVLAVMGGDTASGSSLSGNLNKIVTEFKNEQKKHEKFEKELLKVIKELVTKPEIIQTTVNIDGQKVARQIDKYVRQNQTQHYINGQKGITNAF